MENTPSNKTQAPLKSTNIDIWVTGTLNQLFTRVFILELNFQENNVVRDKTAFFLISPICTPYTLCLNIGFRQGSFV